MTTKLNAATRLSTKIIAAKEKRLKYGSRLYIEADATYINFDSANFDFELIDRTMNIFSGVPNKFVFDEMLSCESGDAILEMAKVLDLAIKSLPVKKYSDMNKLFKPEFIKGYSNFVSDLMTARDEVHAVVDKR